MPLIIPQTTLTDDYQDFIIGGNLVGGNIQITGNPATVQIQHGGQGFAHGVPELNLPLGSYSIGRSPSGIPLTGLRAKNASTGLGAVLGAYFWTETDPSLSFIGLPSAQAVGAVLIPRLTVAEFQALASPSDEQVVIVDLADGTNWMFQFRSSSGEWEFIGGAPIIRRVETAQNTNSAVYVDLATDGPTYTVELDGDYDVSWGGVINDLDGGFQRGSFGLFVAGVLQREVEGFSGGVAGQGTGWSETDVAAVAAQVMKVRYHTDGGNGQFRSRAMVVKPVRVTQ